MNFTRKMTGALVFSTLMMTGVTGAALAADSNPVILDPSAKATLDIHKYNGVNTSKHADGRELPAEEAAKLGKPMANVTFDMYKVEGIDMSTNDGLKLAEAVTHYKPTAADIAAKQITFDGKTYKLTPAGSITTGENGVATGTYDLGVYVVAENLTNYPDANKVTPSAPFTVALPMTNPENRTEWMYDVDVYPKNQVDEITKTVLDGNLGKAGEDAYMVGQDLTYRLTSTVNVGDANGDGAVNGSDLGYYYIEDQLPANEVDFKSATVKVGDTTLTPTTDYTISTTGDKVQISMTDEGLNKLAAHPGATVTTDIVATITAQNAKGTVDNTAWFIPSNQWLVNRGLQPGVAGQPPATTPDKPITSNGATSKFGDIVIHKTNTGGDTNLAGAIFKVYRATNGTTCDAETIKSTEAIATSQPTDANGLTELSGLALSNWYNGKEQTDLHSYCLVESTAPNGYTLLANPVKFDLTVAGDVTDLSAALADTGRDADTNDLSGGTVKIENRKMGELLLTGAEGMTALTVAALLVAGAGVGLHAMSRKKEA